MVDSAVTWMERSSAMNANTIQSGYVPPVAAKAGHVATDTLGARGIRRDHGHHGHRLRRR
jgi:hypothetical protein